MAGRTKTPPKKASAAKKGPAAKKPAAKTAKPAAKKVVKPVKAPAKPAPVAKPAKPAAQKPAAKAAPAKAAPTRVPAARPATRNGTTHAVPVASAPVAPRPLPVKTAPVVSAKDVAAAHEYLLSRSDNRSEEPIVVNGRKLPTEGELLRMSDAQYMNAEQLEFFRYRLQQMERELLANADETTEHLRETVIVPDPADRATIEEEHALELRTRDRERKLLKKVQQALARIESGEYGFCEETGEPIGIPRLLARPTATLSLEAQQRREMKQKMYGD
jgi:DnaK suppressor protein